MFKGGLNVDIREGLAKYPFRVRNGDILNFRYDSDKNPGRMNKEDLELENFNKNPLIIVSGKNMKNGLIHGVNIRLLKTTFPFTPRGKKRQSGRANPSVFNYVLKRAIEYFFLFENGEMLRNDDYSEAEYFLYSKERIIFKEHDKIIRDQLWRSYNPMAMNNVRSLRDEVNEMGNANLGDAFNLSAFWASESASTRNYKTAGPAV